VGLGFWPLSGPRRKQKISLMYARRYAPIIALGAPGKKQKLFVASNLPFPRSSSQPSTARLGNGAD
jgi:hypothetical protein